MRIIITIFALLLQITLQAQKKTIVLFGKVTEAGSNRLINDVFVKLPGSLFSTITNKSGYYSLKVPQRERMQLLFSHLSYNSFIKEIKTTSDDSMEVNVSLYFKTTNLDTIAVTAIHKPETLVGKPNYSVFDFDFYEDKLILLTAKRSLSEAQIQVSDYNGKIFSSYEIPRSAGDALYFFHDYEGYTDLVCKDSVFRLEVLNIELMIGTIPQQDFNRFLKPISDTANGEYYFSDKWDQYPAFNYYHLKNNDTIANLLKSISNSDLLQMYNMQFYYLPSRMQLEARRMADYYKTDRRIIGAMMSGFTKSMFYEPLYAPLFIIRDTICIFNHHNDHLYHYNRNNQLIDSTKILYHHPKNWREWKKQLFFDETENKVYAYFSKNGHHYLRQINHSSGKEILTYKLKYHSAEKIKIRDGYIYYVYRPFGSTQEKFLYREKIE